MRLLALHLMKAGVYPNACQTYRTNIPFDALAQHGHTASWDYIDRVTDDYKRWGRKAWLELVQAYDLLVLPRAAAPTEAALTSIAALVELFRIAGRKIVYETDDDFSNEHRDFSEQGINHALEIASWCDAVTVTTPFLAELMRKRTRRPVYVLPNMVDPRAWVPKTLYANETPLTIGLSGSKTHAGDWRVLEEPLRQVLTENAGKVRLALAAYHPDYLHDLPFTDYVPGMDYLTYAEYVRRTDIVLCPVDPDDGFNLGKSPIKAVEAQAAARLVQGRPAGAAVIATDNPVYRLAVEHGKTGLLVRHTADAWQTALCRLIDEPDLRERLQIAGHASALRKFNIQTGWTAWVRAYQQILAKPAHTPQLARLA